MSPQEYYLPKKNVRQGNIALRRKRKGKMLYPRKNVFPKEATGLRRKTLKRMTVNLKKNDTLTKTKEPRDDKTKIQRERKVKSEKTDVRVY